MTQHEILSDFGHIQKKFPRFTNNQIIWESIYLMRLDEKQQKNTKKNEEFTKRWFNHSWYREWCSICCYLQLSIFMSFYKTIKYHFSLFSYFFSCFNLSFQRFSSPPKNNIRKTLVFYEEIQLIFFSNQLNISLLIKIDKFFPLFSSFVVMWFFFGFFS